MLRTIVSHMGLEWTIFKQAVIPFVVAIDMYYRTEWFELHTSWGHAILGPLFGGGAE